MKLSPLRYIDEKEIIRVEFIKGKLCFKQKVFSKSETTEVDMVKTHKPCMQIWMRGNGSNIPTEVYYFTIKEYTLKEFEEVNKLSEKTVESVIDIVERSKKDVVE